MPCSKEHLSQLESELSELCARDPSSNVPPSAAAAARTAVAPAAAARAAAEPVVIDLENDTVIETVNMVDDTDSAAGKGGQTVQQPSLMWTARFQPAAAAQVSLAMHCMHAVATHTSQCIYRRAQTTC